MIWNKEKSNHMKKIIKMTALCAAIFAANAVQTNAATTNVVQNVDFSLVFYEQGPTNSVGNVTKAVVKKVRVTTKDIIAALGAATTNSFSAKAKLVFVINGTNSASIQVRDNGGIVDASEFFATTNSPVSVHSFTLNSARQTLTGTTYADFQLLLTNNAPSFLNLPLLSTNSNLTASLNLHGFATITHADIVVGHDSTKVIGVDDIDADVSGTGVDTNGVSAVIAGKVSITGHSVVVE
jgi:hypothetical protein